MPPFDLFVLGLGWPWVEESVGFIIVSIWFPTQQSLVNREHPSTLNEKFYCAPPTVARVGECHDHTILCTVLYRTVL